MKVTLSHSLWAALAIAALALTGCPEKNDESDETEEKKDAKKDKDTSATTSKTVEVTTEDPTPGVDSRARAELDGKEPDAGWSGTVVGVAGAKVAFTAGKGWKPAKSGTWATATAADDKAAFVAGSYKEGDDATAKVGEAATALSYANCTWGTAESITLGKDNLPATVADGVCKKGGANVKAVYATMAGKDMNVVAVGGWPDGGDDKSVFNTFRSAKKLGGGSGGIGACCAALRSNAANAPLNQKGGYLMAAGTCDDLRNDPRGAAALGQVRAALAGLNIPSPCR